MTAHFMGGMGEDDARSRRLRRLRWIVILLVIVGMGYGARRVGLVTALIEVWLIIASLLVLIIAWTRWSDYRRQRRWRRDGILFEPQLPRPISSIPEEYEWQLPSDPLIRVPLAVALMALLYWVLVVHGMQLPGSWLVGTVILTLANLWAWREPLLLVLIVGVGVALLALIRWVVQNLSLMGAVVLLLIIVAALIAMWIKIRQRQSRGSSSE
ncbi:MAG: hypothetical protein LW731_10735 [Oxalobacteraceae bacterium]|nr:hypothetical protein [Oxalobacteraceae bacterium]